MPDFIGPVEVPEPPHAGVWPIAPDNGSGMEIAPVVHVHRFEGTNAKLEQRFFRGLGPRRFRVVVRRRLGKTDYQALAAFYEAAKGAYSQFTYNAPQMDGTTIAYEVRFEDQPLSINLLRSWLASPNGIVLVEVPSPAAAPTYAIAATDTGVPGPTLLAALREQAQTIIPLLTIKATDGTTVRVSDRRVTVGSLYRPRLLEWSEIVQTISSSSNAQAESASFTLGNADEVFSQLANQVDLEMAKVEFSLFHVESGILLQLWAGHLPSSERSAWSITPDGRFRMQAYDAAYEITLPYPVRTASSTCWKDFNDNLHCPAATAGGTNLGTPCDKSWDGPAGCVHHTMQRFFGGIAIKQQLVKIKDNSTGVLGFGRSSITSASVASETIYDRVLQEVYTDVPIKVPLDVALGRDDGDFYAAIGVVGEGPIGGFAADLTKHTLDGKPPHDPVRGGGWRYAAGVDPANVPDYFGVGQAPWSGPSAYPNSTYAAGTAFVEIRRTDKEGLQLTKVVEREMFATITSGLGRWGWNAPGDRVWISPCINPIWIAVNAFLRSLGVWVDNTKAASLSPAQMEAYFDVAAAIAAAGVANTNVPKIIGTGNETQFVYRGTIREQKALRDWLQEILNSCLGYFSFSFGRLAVGIRYNASSVTSFGPGNMLLKSLEVQPKARAFNDLRIQFGDQEFEFALNGVRTYDIDHAKKIGPLGRPQYRTQALTLPGVADKSQAARIGETRKREELGGLTGAEQRLAREVSWQSTVMALDVQPGMVVSFPDNAPRLPAGTKVRVTRRALRPDFSTAFTGETVVDSMYDLTVGPKPADANISVRTVEIFPVPDGLSWGPNTVAPIAADPVIIDDLERTFALEQDYQQLADASQRAALIVRGKLPVNSFIPGADAPRILGIGIAAAGGNLPANRTYYIGVCAIDADGRYSPPSNLVPINAEAGADTYRITITSISWPAGVYTGYAVFLGDDSHTVCEQTTITAALPSSIVFGGPFARGRTSFPSPRWSRVRVKAKEATHAGVVGTSITAVPANNKILCGELLDTRPVPDNWVGHIVSVTADLSDGSAPLWNFTVTAFDAATGELTVSPDCVIPGEPENSVQAGDILIIRTKVTAATDTSVTVATWKNRIAPAGLVANAEQGMLLRVIWGKGRGQVRRVIANTDDTHTIDVPWSSVPDATSIFFVEPAEWAYTAETAVTEISRPTIDAAINLPVENFKSRAVIVLCVMVDDIGRESYEEYSPVRDTYLFGAVGNVGEQQVQIERY